MTRGSHTRIDESDLVDNIKAVVERQLGAKIDKVDVLLNSDFSFDDVDVIEIRVIFLNDPSEMAVDEAASLRGELFDMMARNDDNRLPLLRFISKADYAERPH